MCIFPKKEKDSEYLLLYYSYFPVAYRYILRTVQGDITRDPTSKFFFRSEKKKKKRNGSIRKVSTREYFIYYLKLSSTNYCIY